MTAPRAAAVTVTIGLLHAGVDRALDAPPRAFDRASIPGYGPLADPAGAGAIARLFVESAPLPAQLPRGADDPTIGRPERRLHREILCDAIYLATRRRRSSAAPRAYGVTTAVCLAAQHWLASDDPRYAPVSFVVCCEVLGFEPSALRAGIERSRERPDFDPYRLTVLENGSDVAQIGNQRWRLRRSRNGDGCAA